MDESEQIEFEFFATGSPENRSFEEIWDIVDELGEPITDEPAALYFTLNEDDDFRRRVLTLSLGSGLTWSEESKSVHIVALNRQLRFIKPDASYVLNFWIETATGEVDPIITNRAVQAVRVG